MTIKKEYFGTDGIRGNVGQYPINPEFFLKLGWAVGKVLSDLNGGKVLIGKDTRISGYMFESALEAGLSSAGMDIHLLGPMPTPAIAYLTRTLRAKAGIVISASHNPYFDNGIKFFSSRGFKLPDEIEEAIEQQLKCEITTADSACLGKAVRVVDAPGRYIEFCKSTVPHHTDLKGIKIVMDCANGATYHVAPDVFRELGATVIEMSTEPNGFNINEDCGSTHPQKLRERLLAEGADIGLAFDGDGDRVIMVDHLGEIVNGDELVYIIARDRLEIGSFLGGVIGTHMSNLGLEVALSGLNIPFMRTFVGDRYVMLALEQQNWFLGGESSGHIICLDVTTTGDGIISALQVLHALCRTGKTLHELKLGMQKFPQSMINVRHAGEVNPLQNQQIEIAMQRIQAQLNGRGRVLLRPSGTESVIRVMVEGEEETLVQTLAQELAFEVEKLIKVK